MADNPGDPHLAGLIKLLAPYSPGVAGAILSMALGENLTIRGKAVAFVCGIGALLFVAPAISYAIGAAWFSGQLPMVLANFIGFATATFGFAVISGLAQAMARYAKDPMKLVKFQMGGLSIGEGSEG